MKLLSQRVLYSILFYVLIICLIIVAKPSFVFDEQGMIKGFGIGDTKTLFSLGVFVVALSIISFYLFAVIDIVFDK